jgi:hypothetical protein
MIRCTCILLAAVVFITMASRVASAVPEICGNSADDDLNGLTDETCYPTLSTGVCESPLSCGDTGMVSWKSGSLHYALPPDIAPAVPFGPGIGMRRFYTSMYSPGTDPPSVNKTPLGPRWQHTYLTWVRLFTVGVDKKAVHHTSQGRDILYAKTSEDSNFYYYTPQSGEHVLSFKVGKAEFSNTYIQLLTGETLVYDFNGQLIEIWDNYGPGPSFYAKKVLITWTSSSNGNVSTVTDAHGRRRLLFGYTSGLLTSVQYQTFNGGWTTRHTTTYGFTSGNLTSVTIGGALAQQMTYASSYLTQISDAAGNQIASFAYDATTAGKLDRVTTSRGTAGFEYSATRTGCSGTDKTLLYFNLGNTTSCNVDSDCGTGFMCGGKTGSGATGRCFLAARCLTTSLVNGESVVTNVSPLGPGGGSCSGACTDVMQYVWTAASGNINVTGEQDPLGNYTSIAYNSNGLPTQVGYGDTDADPVNGGTNRTTFITYDTTYPGRIAETRRQSDLNTTTCTTSNATGCEVTTYCYSHIASDCNFACNTYDNQLCTVTRSGSTLNASGVVTPFIDTITYHHDGNARIWQIDGAMSGIKTVFTFQDGHALPDVDGFLGDVKLYKNATEYLQVFVSGYDIYGHPTGVKGPDGNLTCDSYDFARGYLTSRRRAMAGQTTCDGSDPLDITTSWTRDSWLRLTQLTLPDATGAGNYCVFYIYDTSGRLSQIKRRDDCNASSAGDYQQFVYTVDSQISEIDTYNASAVLTAKQPYTYFASRRLQKIVNPANTSKFTGMVYDAAGKVTEIDGGRERERALRGRSDHAS